MVPKSAQLDVQSRVSGHEYRLFVSIPASPAPKEGYPVFYVLDGNAAFPVAAFLARAAASRREVTGHVAPLVVGIGYPGVSDFDGPARRRDYTIGTGTPGDGATDGGAERFLEFIEQEVKPLIQARYHVNPERQALFGHSFGGLLVLQALTQHPERFSTYAASSPSIWWGDQIVLKGLPGLLQGPLRPRVQISVGTLEDDPPKGNYSPEVRAMLATRTMIPPARALAQSFKAAPGWEGRVAYYELAGEDHGPVWLPAMSRAMQFFLEQP